MRFKGFRLSILALVGVSTILAGFLIILAFGVLKTYRRSMLQVIEEEGIAFMDAVVEAARSTMESQRVVEDLLSERLLGNGFLIDRLGKLSPEVLAEIAHVNGLEGIDIVNSKGEILTSSRRIINLPFDPLLINPVLMGEKEAWAFLLPDSSTLGVAIRREWGEGVILLYADLEKEESILKSVGLGNLVRKMGHEPQLVYFLLQGREGILYATENVQEMKKIQDDPWILRSIEENKTLARRAHFNGEEVLEVVSPFSENGKFLGVFRLGLSMKSYHSILKAGSKQLVLLSGALLFLLLIVALIFVGNQRVKSLEISYRESKRAFEEIMGKLPLGVLLVGRDLKVEGMNRKAREILGLEEVELPHPYNQMIEGDKCLIEQAIQKGKHIRRSRTPYQDPRGYMKILSVSASPIIEKEGEIRGAISLIEDVTEQVSLEERLRELEKLEALGELTAGVAHDIRNPLNSIAIATQRVKDEAKERLSPEEKELLEQVRREIFRLEDTLNRFLSLAAPLKLRIRPEDPGEIAEEVIGIYRSQAESQEVQIEVSIEKEVKKVPMDREKIREALGNLVKNALEAMPKGGQLTISLEQEPDGVAIKVKDTGPGIPEEDIQRVFRPYFTTKPRGTGIGLSATYRIAILHGGSLTLESRQGEGTTFILFLPYEKYTDS